MVQGLVKPIGFDEFAERRWGSRNIGSRIIWVWVPFD
jgi:hypothetical protein